MSNPALNLADLSLLRALPASTEPPIGLTREQQARAEDLPWGLIRGGRRTELGDYVLTLVEERDAYKRAKEENDERFQLEAGEQHARADALQKRLDALLAPAQIDVDELQRQNERWTAALEQGDAEAARAAQAYLAGAAAALLRVVVQQGARLEAILAPLKATGPSPTTATRAPSTARTP